VLDGLQHACDTVLGQPLPDITGPVGELAARMVALAGAEAQAAAQQVRAEADRTAAELQARIRQLEADVQRANSALQTARAEAEQERHTRSGLESALKEAERAREQLGATHERELARLKQVLETERVDRAHLRAQVSEALQAALVSLEGQSAPPPPSGPGGPHADRRGSANEEQTRQADRSAAAPASPAAPVNVVAHRPLTLVRDQKSGARPAVAGSPSASELLAEAEAAYREDVDAGVSPSEIVTRLTANLATARERFTSARGGQGTADTAFKDQLIALLNAKYDSQFGRHLSIAMYDLYGTTDKSTEHVA
jgi:hypothetical protein